MTMNDQDHAHAEGNPAGTETPMRDELERAARIEAARHYHPWRRPEPGDIVQHFGVGRGMLVLDANSHPDRWWPDDAALCAWTEHGQKHTLLYPVINLEIVGTRRRRSDREVYDKLTAIAIETITAMAADKRHERARGAFRLWSDLVGALADEHDALRLQQLVNRSEEHSF